MRLWATPAGCGNKTHLAFGHQAPCVVAADYKTKNTALSLANAVIRMPIDCFVFDTLPDPFHEDIVLPTLLAMHADLDAMVF